MGAVQAVDLSHYDNREDGVENYGSYKLNYLGSTTMAPPTSKATIIQATKTILAKQNQRKKVVMNVSSLGVELFDLGRASTSASIASIAVTPMQRLIHISILGKARSMIVYIHKETEHVLICHLLTSKKRCPKAINAVNEAFQGSKRLNEMLASLKKDPSLVVSEIQTAHDDDEDYDEEEEDGYLDDDELYEEDIHGEQRSRDGESGTQSSSSSEVARHPLSQNRMRYNSSKGRVEHEDEAVMGFHRDSLDSDDEDDSSAAVEESDPLDQSVAVIDLPPAQFACTYLGHTAVTRCAGEDMMMLSAQQVLKKSGGNSGTDTTGSMPTALSAALLSTPVHISATLVISDSIEVRADNGEILQRSAVTNITAHMRMRKNPTVLTFVTRDLQGIMFCHTVEFKKKKVCAEACDAMEHAIEAKSPSTARRASDTAAGKASSLGKGLVSRQLTAASLVAKTKGSSALQPNGDSSFLLGMFEAEYLGSYPIVDLKSQAACEYAAMKVLDEADGQSQHTAVAVSGEGIKVVESVSSDLVTNLVIRNITFATLISKKNVLKKVKARKGEETLFSIVYHDARLQRIVCEVFRGGRRAAQICECISFAFKVAADRLRKTKNNPFISLTSKREIVPSFLHDKQIRRSALKPISPLGVGQFGEVYLAEQRIVTADGRVKEKVLRACKMLRISSSDTDNAEFVHETEVMAALDHENLITLIGVSMQHKPWLCVLEYMEYGDLKSVVCTAREKGMQLTILEFLKLMIQIAKGMEYMASQGYIHMDLAARNCLLSSENTVKIGDFGLTLKTPKYKDYYRLDRTLRLPIKWMALESLTDKIFSTKSDVWAFGVTCWELFSYGAVPYPDLKSVHIADHLMDGQRLQRPKACPESFFAAILAPSWSPNWRERPTFNELRRRIAGFGKSARKYCPPMRDIGQAIRIWDKSHERDQKSRTQQALNARDRLREYEETTPEAITNPLAPIKLPRKRTSPKKELTQKQINFNVAEITTWNTDEPRLLPGDGSDAIGGKSRKVYSASNLNRENGSRDNQRAADEPLELVRATSVHDRKRLIATNQEQDMFGFMLNFTGRVIHD